MVHVPAHLRLELHRNRRLVLRHLPQFRYVPSQSGDRDVDQPDRLGEPPLHESIVGRPYRPSFNLRSRVCEIQASMNPREAPSTEATSAVLKTTDPRQSIKWSAVTLLPWQRRVRSVVDVRTQIGSRAQNVFDDDILAASALESRDIPVVIDSVLIAQQQKDLKSGTGLPSTSRVPQIAPNITPWQ